MYGGHDPPLRQSQRGQEYPFQPPCARTCACGQLSRRHGGRPRKADGDRGETRHARRPSGHLFRPREEPRGKIRLQVHRRSRGGRPALCHRVRTIDKFPPPHGRPHEKQPPLCPRPHKEEGFRAQRGRGGCRPPLCHSRHPRLFCRGEIAQNFSCRHALRPQA